MNWLRSIIYKKAEKRIAQFENNYGLLTSEQISEYQNLLPIIEKIYRETKYWHGTGRLQYARSTSRYDTINNFETIDILDSILSDDKLKPHPDISCSTILHRRTFSTVPLSDKRILARIYACLYFYEKENLFYEFGNKKLWYPIIGALDACDLNFVLFNIIHLPKTSITWHWIQAFRKNLKKFDVINVFKIHELSSDIQKNYPILFGVKENAFHKAHINPILDNYEVRTYDSIFLDGITHIEVPLRNIQETAELMKKYNISVPLIPMEYFELYCSTLPLVELV